MASLSQYRTTSCQHPDGIRKPIPVKNSLHLQGQISWYSSVQSSSIFRFRLAHKPLYILRFKKIEQGQLSYPKICPLYFRVILVQTVSLDSYNQACISSPKQ